MKYKEDKAVGSFCLYTIANWQDSIRMAIYMLIFFWCNIYIWSKHSYHLVQSMIQHLFL